VSREIEDQILRIFADVGDGFYGTISIELKCKASVIETYKIGTDRTYKPGEERRIQERRTAGPRDGEDRRKQ